MLTVDSEPSVGHSCFIAVDSQQHSGRVLRGLRSAQTRSTGTENGASTVSTPQSHSHSLEGNAHGTTSTRKVAISSGIGATIEAYDFIGYGTAAALYFSTDFFPSGDPLTGTLLSFATLGVGFLVRPLGGVIGGYLGDKVGRKPVLVASLMLMGLATFAIGLLPTYQTVGIWAGILLVFVRVVQGLPTAPNGAAPSS